jgi:peptidoglycan/xylan/chitin deacetylase (PgdA/CDA1 family)
MIEVCSPFPDVNENPRILDEFYLESGQKKRFAPWKRLYYSMLRPVLPLPLRKKLQKKYLAPKKRYLENFIDSRLVDLILENPDNQKRTESFYPDKNRAALILTHDVETQEGFDHIPKIFDLENSLGFKSSWNIVPYKYKIDRGIVDSIKDAGHEIGIHGYNHDGKLYYSHRIFKERARLINRAIDEFQAVGFRSPSMHRNLEWLQDLKISYDASSFDYDPFQPFPGGTGSIWPFLAGKFVELPYTLPQDHTLFYILGEKDTSIWQNKVQWLIEKRGMILSLTHPDYLVEAEHFEAYRNFLDFLKSLTGLWHCLPMEMAAWWKNLSSESGP